MEGTQAFREARAALRRTVEGSGALREKLVRIAEHEFFQKHDFTSMAGLKRGVLAAIEVERLLEDECSAAVNPEDVTSEPLDTFEGIGWLSALPQTAEERDAVFVVTSVLAFGTAQGNVRHVSFLTVALSCPPTERHRLYTIKHLKFAYIRAGNEELARLLHEHEIAQAHELQARAVRQYPNEHPLVRQASADLVKAVAYRDL